MTRRQLGALGIGRKAIDHRMAVGRLHSVHRGTYAVGHRLLTRDGRWIAAVLAAGDGALLSHRSAGALWGVASESAGRIEVTVRGARRDRPGLAQHCSSVPPDESTAVRGIPVTTAARTLLDLAGVVPARVLRRALHEAEAAQLWDAVSLLDVIGRHPGRRGVAKLRSLLAEGALGATVSRSELELRFLELVADARLPAPQANLQLQAAGSTVEADFVWQRKRLIVELDGHATHATRAGFERDRERDRVLQTAGWKVVRVTWRQLHGDAEAVARDLARLLR